MLYRNVVKELESWKKRSHHPLLVCGLRQTGKTFSVQQFCKENYTNVVYIDFRANKSIHKVFDGDFNVDLMVMEISANMPNIKVEANNTVFIFDEIQDCPNARSSFKYWDLDGRYDVIATGSFLGVKGFRKAYARGIPVGYEEKIIMYPLTFKEFLINVGINEKVFDYIEEALRNKTKISDAVNESMKGLYKQYLIVGGMPEAINVFLETHNVNEVRSIQKRIINSLRDDFGRYIDSKGEEKINETLKIRSEACLNSLPSQLAKEYKKFQFSLVETKGKAHEKAEGIEYLADLGLVIKVHNLQELAYPLEAQKKENEYKVYFADCGLLMSQLDQGTAVKILDDDFGAYKGAIAENIVVSQLNAYGYETYYYRAPSGSPELDFVLGYQNEVVLIEVKASNNRATSMNYVLNNPSKYGKHKAFKIANANIGEGTNYLTLPLYAVGFIKPEEANLIIEPIKVEL